MVMQKESWSTRSGGKRQKPPPTPHIYLTNRPIKQPKAGHTLWSKCSSVIRMNFLLSHLSDDPRKSNNAAIHSRCITWTCNRLSNHCDANDSLRILICIQRTQFSPIQTREWNYAIKTAECCRSPCWEAGDPQNALQMRQSSEPERTDAAVILQEMHHLEFLIINKKCEHHLYLTSWADFWPNWGEANSSVQRKTWKSSHF